jgi:hypothetical protein
MSTKYPEVNFAKINAAKAKFFVNKLNIQVLPAVLCFVDGVLKHRIIGFEMFNNNDDFTTRSFEKKLWKFRFLTRPAGEDLDSGSENEEEEIVRRETKFRSAPRKNNDSDDSD